MTSNAPSGFPSPLLFQVVPPSVEYRSRPFTPWLFQFNTVQLGSLMSTGSRIMKYDWPPVTVTPEMPLMVTRPQQPPKDWVVVRLFQKAPATWVPGVPALSVQMLA